MFYNNNYQLNFLSQKKYDSIFLEDSKISRDFWRHSEELYTSQDNDY